MKSVRVQLELLEDGEVDIKCSQQDAGITVIILEKAKLKLLGGIQLKSKEDSGIIVPKNRFKI